MPSITFQLPTIISELENGHCLGNILLLPQATAYGEDTGAVRMELSRVARHLLPTMRLLDLHRQRLAGDFEVRDVLVEVPSPATRLWNAPLDTRFPVICWNHGNQTRLAYVPSLDIAILTRQPEELERLIKEHIRFALLRRNVGGRLRELILLQRTELVTVSMFAQTVEIPSARQIVAQDAPARQPSVLQEVAWKLTGSQLPPVFGYDKLATQLGQWLYGSTRRSVLLVGPSGVGKTAVVHALAADTDRNRAARGPLWSTSGARLVAGMCGFGMWQERCQNLIREAAAHHAIVHLGNLMELLQVGQSEGNNLGVGDFLRPAIARGELLVIAECTPEQLALMERTTPGMLEAFVRMDIQEPSAESCETILQQAEDFFGHGKGVQLDQLARATLDRLHRRYATYSAYPSRPLRFLKHLLEDSSSGQTLTSADITQAFSRETGLPRQLLEDTMPLDLAATRDWFRQRVIGQDQAVEITVDLLATTKADLARPGRPLASLLFIGPTGVGKTEMAKSLAEFLYRDRQRLTRIDMSEYADPMAIDRLIGNGLHGEGLLTSKAREQPFGVVLLDEFEKAHPRFFDLLLQVLGEGRLTDGAGRVADFRNAVIIMTSNLGAESFGRRAAGFGGVEASRNATEDHFATCVRQFLRPEIFNRIDRIVTFLPLDKSVLHDIAHRELRLLSQRDGARYRSIQLEFDSELPGWLVDRCHDARYGARPLKRAIEQHVLAPVAAAVNILRTDRPLHVRIAPGARGVRVHTRHDRSPAGNLGAMANPREMSDLTSLAETCVALRRQALRLEQSQGWQELRNEVYRLRRSKTGSTSRPRKQNATRDAMRDARLAHLEPLATRVEQIVADTVALDDQVLGALYLGHEFETEERERLVAEVADRSQQLDRLSLELFAMHHERPDYVTLCVYGEHTRWRESLAQSYYDLATAREFRVEAYELLPCAQRPAATSDRILLGDRDSKDAAKRRQANETRLLAKRIKSTEAPLANITPQAIGVAFCIAGPGSWLLLQPEQGLHVWQEGGAKRRCLVHASQATMSGYQPPFRIDRREGIGGQEVRRQWSPPRKSIDDRLVRGKLFWTGETLAPELANLIERHLKDRVEDWMGS